MWKPADPMALTPDQQWILEAWVRAQKTPQSIVRRAKIVLMGASGLSNNRIAAELNTSRPTVIEWRRRFQESGVDALTHIRPGRGRRVSISAERVQAIVDATLQTKPAGATHWSRRTMAKAQGVSHSMVHRIWDAHGLQPQRTKRFKLSKDIRFTEKLTDVVGLYLNPPDKAIVLCVDEKSQIQALQRTQPGLPMKKGRSAQGKGLARKAPTLHATLHAHELVMAEPCRALVPGVDGKACAAWKLRKCAGVDPRH